MSLLKNTFTISITTIISRILGYFRDVVIASHLGTGPLNDAFIAAFKFTNLFRNVFGEGAMTAAFVPMFNHKISKEGLSSSLNMAAVIHSILTISLIIFCGLMVLNMRYVLAITTPGFTSDSYYFELAIDIARITFPYLFFISLVAFYGGILNSLNKFIPFAATSIIFNISIIIFCSFFDFGATAAHNIAYGVLVAGALELIWMLFFLKINKISIKFHKPKLTHDVKTVLTRAGSSLFSSGIAQINTMVDMIIVSFIPGGLSYIYYADRLVQLPLAVVATATSTALLPSLSRYVAAIDDSKCLEAKEMALKVSGFFLIPSTLILCYFAEEITGFLLERGNFDSDSTLKTAAALRIISISLPAFAIIKLFNSSFYARGDTKTTVKVAGIALVLNIIIAISLVHKFNYLAASLASTISSWFTAIALIFISNKQRYYKFNKILYYDLLAQCIFSVSILIIMINALRIFNIPLLLNLLLEGSCYTILWFTYKIIHKKIRRI